MRNIQSFMIERDSGIIRVDVRNHLLKSNYDISIPVKVWEKQYEIIRNAYWELNRKHL
jgi:hypothetical protein